MSVVAAILLVVATGSSLVAGVQAARGWWFPASSLTPTRRAAAERNPFAPVRDCSREAEFGALAGTNNGEQSRTAPNNHGTPKSRLVRGGSLRDLCPRQKRKGLMHKELVTH
jgi:hypothetical protein